MDIKYVLNKTSLKFILAAFISYYFGSIALQSNFKAVGIIGVVIFVFVFLTRVEYAFYFLLASRAIVETLYYFQVTGNVRITHLMGGGIVVLFMYYAIVVSRYNLFKLGINKIYIIFIILCIPTIFFSESLRVGIAYWFKLIQGFAILNLTVLVVISAENELYKKRINILCWSTIISLVIPYIAFLNNVIQGKSRIVGGVARYSFTGGFRNSFSYLSFIVFPFCLYMYSVTKRHSKKILWIILMAVISWGIYMNQVRNIWIALGILLLSWNQLRKSYMFICFIIIAIIIVFLFSPAIQDRFEDIYSIMSGKGFFDLDPGLLSYRIGNWQANIHHFIYNSSVMEKLLGNGYDINEKIELFAIKKYRYGKTSAAAHNSYLTLLMTTGICGLSAYFLYIFKLLQESFKLLGIGKRDRDIYFINLSHIFISLIYAYLVLSIFTHILWNITFQYFFSVFAGLIIACNIIGERRKIIA
jgi:hypothetical protein